MLALWVISVSFLSSAHAKENPLKQTAYLYYKIPSTNEQPVDITVVVEVENISKEKQVLKYLTVTLPFQNVSDIHVKLGNKVLYRKQTYKNKSAVDLLIDTENFVLDVGSSKKLVINLKLSDFLGSLDDEIKYLSLPGRIIGIKTANISIMYPV